MKTLIALFAASLSLTLTAAAQAAEADAGRAAFREIYEEMVEIDSSQSTGSCTKVVRAAETRLKAAGFGGGDMQVVIPEGKPDDGNIVARIRAQNPAKKGVLLLAHIDVVDARREDWERDPFTLIEENGFFYGRGSADDKSMAAVFLDLMIRLKQERNFKPRRDVVMALTCGEETSNRVNGVDYLLQEPSRADRCGVRAQRRRGRAAVRGRQAADAAGAGRREDPPGVSRSRSPTRAAIPRGRCRTTPSIAWRRRRRRSRSSRSRCR